RYDPHLYSFFLTRKSTKNIRAIFNAPEFTHPMNLEDLWDVGAKERYDAKKTKIESLDLNEKEKFYYLFDFGDNWLFEIRKSRKKAIPKENAEYPQVVTDNGIKLRQYIDYDFEE
ncbi:MAG: plasmid pRiA4b ORF-3 family protein, partial [Deltaproteobacteria bacterium]|nr:plasmid pRiA4b ORF-3 family protein [Deltaproteobacteria bacterium]